MADESILRAVRAGRSYDDLPVRARDLISRSSWNRKVCEACAKKRLRWGDVPALQQACPKEQDYYAQVVRISTAAQQIFPYHLFPQIKVTPFKYYIGILHQVLKKDQSYAEVPNFTAADMVRVTGVGRDEYVPLLQSCKAKRILWKVNRDSAIRDQLPSEPKDLLVEPWWQLRAVSAVSPGGDASTGSGAADQASSGSSMLSTSPFSSARDSSRDDQELAPEEQRFLERLALQPLPVDQAVDTQMWKRLYRRGLVHVEVPMGEDDCIAVPPLEGFVSNKDGDEDSDPVEKLLYGMFFAASARTTIRELAHVLGAPISEVREAASVACRLGFARRTTQERRRSFSAFVSPRNPGDADAASESSAATTTPLGAVESTMLGATSRGGEHDSDSPLLVMDPAAAGSEEMQMRKGIAFVVDTEVTATLMMGSLLKDQRHAVTLFEAGKLSGRLAVRELLDELSRVPATGEGEIQFLVDQIQSLEMVLKLICSVESDNSADLLGGGMPPEIDILRYEVLADLPPSTLDRMLSQHYFLVVFMARTPFPLLKVPIWKEEEKGGAAGSNPRPSCPVVHGLPSGVVAMPWMQLALFQELGKGLVTCVFPKGAQLTRLPEPEFSARDLLLLRAWPEEEDGGRHPQQMIPEEGLLISGAAALAAMNHALLSSALLVQKVDASESLEAGAMAGGGRSGSGNGSALITTEVALPLPVDSEHSEQEWESLSLHSRDVQDLVQRWRLEHAIGFVTLLRVGPGEAGWLPIGLNLGIDVHRVDLCRRQVASAGGFAKFQQRTLLEKVQRLGEAFGVGRGLLPTRALVFDGAELRCRD